jgi:hypothetical protein
MTVYAKFRRKNSAQGRWRGNRACFRFPQTLEQATPRSLRFPQMIEQALLSHSPNARTAEPATPHRSRFPRMIERAMPSLSRDPQRAEHRPK